MACTLEAGDIAGKAVYVYRNVEQYYDNAHRYQIKGHSNLAIKCT